MQEKTPLWKKIMYAILLVLPLALALLWLYYITAAEKAIGIGAGAFLSPANSQPLISGILIFAAAYTLFLIVIFYSNIKEVIKHTFHKEE